MRNLVAMTDADLGAQIEFAELSADAARAAGDRVTERRWHNRLRDAIGEAIRRGFIVVPDATSIGAAVRAADGRLGHVTDLREDAVTVDWGTALVPGVPGSRYTRYLATTLASGALRAA